MTGSRDRPTFDGAFDIYCSGARRGVRHQATCPPIVRKKNSWRVLPRMSLGLSRPRPNSLPPPRPFAIMLSLLRSVPAAYEPVPVPDELPCAVGLAPVACPSTRLFPASNFPWRLAPGPSAYHSFASTLVATLAEAYSIDAAGPNAWRPCPGPAPMPIPAFAPRLRSPCWSRSWLWL